MFILVTLENSP